MTAQLSDIYYYRGEEWDIAAVEKVWPFDIKSLGVKPVPPHTACWNGYVCEYAIEKDKLLLQNLQLCLDEEYPEINGVKAVNNPKDKVVLWGFKKYEEINIKVKYSGGLIIAREFIDDYYIHMGYHHPYAYRQVYELIFEDGNLVEEINRSDDMERLREEEKLDSSRGIRFKLKESVEAAFSLDYSNKWI